MEYSTPVALQAPSFYECHRIVSELEEHDWKPCVTLVRYGVVPSPDHTTLWGKLTTTLLQRFFTPHSQTGTYHLTLDGQYFFAVATRPLLSSMLISMLLSRIPGPESIELLRTISVSKELSVMESQPRESVIRWNILFDHTLRHQPMYDGCEVNVPVMSRIQSSFRRFRSSYDLKVLWPYSTMRGISSESASEYLGRTLHLKKPWYEDIPEIRPVSSRDVVATFLHHGFWISGPCEMKQRWYASGLNPRTYFAQGGEAIRVSCYLREFFNQFCDTFLPTERHARVDASRLVTYDGGYFFIYDLTSFTSNFHEQLSFLRSVANFFRETTVLLVSTGLELIPHSLGDLIDEYAEVVNNNPRYRLSSKLFDLSKEDTLYLTHHVAGFLGVPGNLATCTLAHGTLIAQHLDSVNRQSCAGDDGCAACREREHQRRIERSVMMIGLFQKEKGSTTDHGQAASYLKRRFLQNGKMATLIQRVEYPLLSLVHAYIKPDPRFPELSLDRKKIRSSIAKSLVSFIRSCFEYTNGHYLTGELECIIDFLSYIYRLANLPRGGQVRGMLFDDSDTIRKVNDAIVFPLERRYFEEDPDQLLVERFMPWVVHVPEMTEKTIFDFEGDWYHDETRVCQMSGGLEQLVKYGWVSRKQSNKRVLVGVDARRYFRRLMKEEIIELEYEYTARADLPSDLLVRLGITDPGRRPRRHDYSHQYRSKTEYVDLDEPEQLLHDSLSILTRAPSSLNYDD